MMASVTYLTRISGYVFLGSRSLNPRIYAFRIVHSESLIGKVRARENLEMVTVADLIP